MDVTIRNRWAAVLQYLGFNGGDVPDMESTENKTDDVAGNAESSEKYASTKGVAVYVASTLGDVETLLSQI